ncbi:MAG: MBL fold metallo-hydrolase [Bacteroidaceae bacterium]|nr:MBL fold metallo-hydrolase [Bacteroidaceae bacterium]
MNITKDIQYVGVDDTDIDLFESQYAVPEGVSYNSYLILDDEVAIMDSVDRRRCDAWLARLTDALAGREPHYLVVQHMEPDHGGSIAAAMERWPEMKIVTSVKAAPMLKQFFGAMDFTDRVIAVKEGDTLSLGRHTLQFIMAPMVHWPEVMVTYEQTDKTLFTADGFGTFGALHGNINDLRAWPDEARRYYYNICGKYGQPVQALLKKVGALDVQRICPLHGPVLTEDLGYYIGLYDKWSRYEAESEGVLIAYASIHGNTATAAHALAAMIQQQAEGTEVKLIDLCRTDVSVAVAEAFRMGRMVLAASSYDGGLFTPMYEFLHRIQIKGYKGRRVGLIENGSWAPSAGRVMKEMLAAMKDIDLVEPMVTIRSTMQPTDEPAMKALAEAII